MFWVLQKKHICQFLGYKEAFLVMELFDKFPKKLFLTTTFMLELIGN